jgi:MFS family permease
MGRLSDRIDRRLVLIGLAGMAAVVGAIIVILNPQAGWVMYVLFAAYGFAANPIYAVAVAHANDFARDGDFAKIAGGMLLILGVGLAIGPAVASLIMGAWSPVGLFIVTAVFHALLGVAAILRMRVRKSIDAADRAPFQPMDKQQTLESIVLDPRAEHEDIDMPVDEPLLPEELATPVEPEEKDQRHV